MAEIIDKEITSVNSPWENYKGKRVREFIQKKLGEHDDGLQETIKGVTLNGSEVTKDGDGKVNLLVNTVEVDASLDETSTNAVSNAAATKKINDLEDSSLAGFDVEENDDGTSIKLSALNKRNGVITSVDLPLGGSGGDVSISKPKVTASVDKSQVKEGGKATLTYSYDHVDGTGASDGVKGTLQITINRGTTQTYNATIENVDAGTIGTLDISPYLLAGTVDIYVKATCITADGTTQTKQAYTSVSVITLNLTSSFNIAAALTKGGYSNETIEIPFTIIGSGSKVVTLYIDGTQKATKTISRSGTTNESFSINAADYAAGRHNIQLVAERDSLLSDSIFMDFLVAGSSVPFIGTKLTFEDGRIYTSSLIPTLDAGQYEQMSFDYAVWNPDDVTSEVDVMQNTAVVASMSVSRQLQTYTNRFTTNGIVSMAFVCGATTYPFNVNVESSTLDISETTANLQLKLSAAGRSNGEANPAEWGGITTFKNFDFKSSGWNGDALKAMNGAIAVINAKPFETDAATTGLTVEIEFMISNVMDKSASVISCMYGGRGFNITADEAMFYTGTTKKVQTAETDADGNYIYRDRPTGVNMKFASDLWLKVAFVLHTRTDNSLMELYINGVRSKADVYGSGDIFRQAVAQGITIDSTGADVQVRNLRIYNRAINDDEEVNNFIIDRPNGSDMTTAFNSNNIFGEDGKVSADILRSKGKGVVVFVRANALDDVNGANDKKKDFPTEKVYWYSPYGSEYDFVAENINIRIQGTSSTKYPRKNYRLYLAKGNNPTLTVNGELVSGNKYSMKPGAIAMNLFCLKADFSDSSMVMNTGGANLFDWTMRQLELLTPPQEKDEKVRQSIDGIPCDVFCCTEDGGELTYYGQYNFNNEKSKSGKLFGMEGVDGFTPDCPIALEALNNSNPCCLFQAPKTNLDNWLSTNFDAGFEFNYPEDVFWTDANAAKNKGTVATSAQKTAIRRLMNWIVSVTPANADVNDISSFASTRFKNEVSNYFDMQHLLTYYLITDYWGSVDQRAKNILWRTWDGLKWYATFYDGDTAMGVRNDSFLAYLYNMTRDTYDEEALKYAFEGHDSYLWCLVLANLEDELKAACDALRGVLTTEKMLQVFNEQWMGNWCERLYNKSGEFKYILPQLVGVPVDGYQDLVKYSYMYALTGNREAHRTYFLRERGTLLDARYGTSGFQADNIDIYVNRAATDATDTIKLISGDLYYFGYRTNNGGWLDGPKMADVGDEVTLEFTAALAINDPVRFCGASKITKLDMRGISGHVLRQLGLNKCKMLREFIFSTELTGKANANWFIDWMSCTQLEVVDLTGQTSVTTTDGGAELNMSVHTKLRTLLVGDTGLTSYSLAEGAPLTTLVLPATLTSLSLRYLPSLTMSGLTLQGCENVVRFNFASCPYLDWQTILAQCTNVEYIRVEGITGKIDLATLQKYQNIGGIDADGNVTDTCRLVGSVMLTEVVEEATLTALRTHYPELTIKECQFSHYWFDDVETDPANITNEDNKTGYYYMDENTVSTQANPNGYEASGHVKLIHDKCQLVSGRINSKTGKMKCTKLSKDSLFETADGATFNPTDPNGELFDVFLYLPKYYYKGVNDYKNARKHLFLSARDTAPDHTDTITKRFALADILLASGKAVSNEVFSEGETFDDSDLTTATECSAYKVDVQGMKQVRFPGINHSYFSHLFTDEDGNILTIGNLLMQDYTGNPSDFMNDEGDYDFRDVPDGAKWFYFTCRNLSAAKEPEVIVTDSAEIEAIEPDWVEHQSELIGVYQGFAVGITTGGTPTDATVGLRSISGKVMSRGSGTSTQVNAWTYDTDGNPTALSKTRINGTAQDFFNLARLRGEGYSTVPYETSKDMANLLMAWFGTRDVETIVGRGSSAGETTGVRNAIAFGDSAFTAQNQHNKMWGLECWTASTYEWTDKGCFNAPSFDVFYKNKRVEISTWAIDYYYNILQQDGKERRVKAATLNQATNVARVRFGRYCDIVVSAYAGDATFAKCYAAYQSSNGSRGRVLGRSYYSANAFAGVAYSNAVNAYSYSSTNAGGRLCFFGEIENESELLG